MDRFTLLIRFMLRPLADLRDWLYCSHRHLSAPRISGTGRVQRECFDCLRVITSPVDLSPLDYLRGPRQPVLKVETALEREAREAAERELARRVKQVEDDEREWYGRR